MTAANEQIVTAFEVENMQPEEIAETFEYDVTAVKAILLQSSTIYRKASKQDITLAFNEQQAEEMKDIILSIARYAEEDHVRLKAAIHVRDDALGRLEMPKGNTFNFQILQFNEQMKKVKAAKERTLLVSEQSERL